MVQDGVPDDMGALSEYSTKQTVAKNIMSGICYYFCSVGVGDATHKFLKRR